MTTVVLLHAFPVDASMYDGIRETVGAACDLLTPDLPGFGGRSLPAEEPSLDVFADDLAATLDRLGVDEVVLGGTSMGGYTTLAFLRRYPQRVRGLVLVDTKASADTAEAATGRRAMADRLQAEESTRVLVEQVYPRLLGATTFEQRPALVEQLRLRVAAAPPRSAAWAQRAMAARRDCVDVLRAYSRPTLIVVGEEDVVSPPSEAQVMADALASLNAAEVSLSVIPGVGHLTPLEAPGSVASAVAGFVGRLG